MRDWQNVLVLTRGTDLPRLLESVSARVPYTLDVTSDSGELLNVVRERQASLVILDARRHSRVVGSVPELLRLAQRLGVGGTRTLVVTAKRAVGRYSRHLQEFDDPVHLLVKPFDVTQFQAMLRGVINVDADYSLGILALDPLHGFDAVIPHLDAASWRQAWVTVDTATRRLAHVSRQLRS
jgi:DNA-binding response OmpR family regulator